MRFYLSPLLVLFLCTCVRAQITNFQPATVTLASGATETGWVSAEGSASLAKQIRFRPEKSDKDGERTIAPKDLRSLTFTETNVQYLPFEYVWQPVAAEEGREIRLGELLYDGVYDLVTLDRASDEYLSLNNEIRPQVYYLLDGDISVPLERIQRQVAGNSESKYSIVDAYKGKLQYYFRDWPKAAGAIKNLRYTDKELINIFDDYSTFSNPDMINTTVGREKTSLQYVPRIMFSPKHRFSSVEDANGTAIGGGLLLRRPMDRSNGLTVLEFGLEALLYSFEDAPQRNLQTAFDNVVMFRVPVYGDVYLSRQDNFQLRGRLGGSASLAAISGVQRSFLQSGEFSDVSFDYSLYGGAGFDVKNFAIDVGYDLSLGPVIGLSYRITQR